MREDTYDGETVELPKAKSKEGIRCDACPVLCLVKPNGFGACDRYTNIDGVLTRTDPLVITQKPDSKVVKFLDGMVRGMAMSSTMRRCLSRASARRRPTLITNPRRL